MEYRIDEKEDRDVWEAAMEAWIEACPESMIDGYLQPVSELSSIEGETVHLVNCMDTELAEYDSHAQCITNDYTT